jgi:anti-sigma B factor antagonist
LSAWPGLPFSAVLWEREHAAILTLSGDVDAVAVERLDAALAELMESGCTLKVADLTLASFIDSTAIARLVAVDRFAAGASRFIVVCPPILLRTLQRAGIDTLLELRTSLADALTVLY